MEAVLIIAALIAIAFVWQWIKAQTRKAAKRHIFERHNHAEGKNLTNTVTRFTVAAPAQAVVHAVESALTAKPAEGWFNRQYSVLRRGPDGLTVKFGTRYQDSFTVDLALEPADGGRLHGTYEVVQVMTSDGVVAKVDHIRDCRDSVLRAIASVDRSATFSDQYEKGRIL